MALSTLDEKDTTYKVELSILHSKWKIAVAKCKCPAGKGPASSILVPFAICFKAFVKMGQNQNFYLHSMSTGMGSTKTKKTRCQASN